MAELLHVDRVHIRCPIPFFPDRPLFCGLYIKTKSISNKAIHWFFQVSLKMFYSYWPLLIIWLYKFQFPFLKGHTGRLESLVFTWLWNTRYLYDTIDRTWQMHASSLLVVLLVMDKFLLWPLSFRGWLCVLFHIVDCRVRNAEGDSCTIVLIPL